MGWAQVAGSCIILSWMEAWKHGLRLKKEWRLPPKEWSQFEFESQHLRWVTRSCSHFVAIFLRVQCPIYSRPRSRRIPHLRCPRFRPSPPAPSTSVSEPHSSLAPARLAHSITFDLCAVRASLLLDIASLTLVAFHLSTSPLVFVGVTSSLTSPLVLTPRWRASQSASSRVRNRAAQTSVLSSEG